MKIVHIADVHIRLLKRHKEYREVFEDLKASLSRTRPDAVVVAGDLLPEPERLVPRRRDPHRREP